MIGSSAVAAFIAQLAFFALLAAGVACGRLAFRGAGLALLVWVAAYLFAGLFFSPIVATLDVVLVFIVVRGDIRLT
jgi:hypothetical protein